MKQREVDLAGLLILRVDIDVHGRASYGSHELKDAPWALSQDDVKQSVRQLLHCVVPLLRFRIPPETPGLPRRVDLALRLLPPVR